MSNPLDNILWGYQGWRVQVMNDDKSKFVVDGNEVIFNFPKCNQAGLLYSADEISFQTEFDDYEIEEEIIGDRLIFEMNYTDYISAVYILYYAEMKKYRQLGKRLLLTPRIDYDKAQFWVRITSKSFDFPLINDGAQSKGHSDVKWTFETTEPYTLLDVMRVHTGAQYQFIDDMFGMGNF